MPKLKERFEDRIQITPGCWLWTASLDRKGYGRIRERDKTLAAHRVSYQLYNGDIPNELIVRHKCDNPACVNPDHLELGTFSDNTMDSVRRGRWKKNPARGSKSGRAKLTEQDVLSIRHDLRPHRKIAAEYNLDPSSICAIKQRRIWKHI